MLECLIATRRNDRDTVAGMQDKRGLSTFRWTRKKGLGADREGLQSGDDFETYSVSLGRACTSAHAAETPASAGGDQHLTIMTPPSVNPLDCPVVRCAHERGTTNRATSRIAAIKPARFRLRTIRLARRTPRRRARITSTSGITARSAEENPRGDFRTARSASARTKSAG